MSYPEYEDDVLRTLSLQFNIGGQPGDGSPTPPAIAATLRRAIEIGEEVDVLKRAIFYGSSYDGSATVSEEPDATLRIAQAPDSDRPSEDMLHSAMGLFTEAAEFLSAIYTSCFENQPFDATNAKEELGDLEWYMAVMRKRLGVSQEQVQRINIAKLRARYPEKFTSVNALNRDLGQERAILETPNED